MRRLGLQLAMTAPIDLDFTSSNRTIVHPPTSMAFLYASPSLGKIESDGKVQVIDLPAITVLSVGVRGSCDRPGFERGKRMLNAWLDEHGGQYQVARPLRFLGYNTPFVPWFLRYGEVQLPVRGGVQ